MCKWYKLLEDLADVPLVLFQEMTTPSSVGGRWGREGCGVSSSEPPVPCRPLGLQELCGQVQVLLGAGGLLESRLQSLSTLEGAIGGSLYLCVCAKSDSS